MSAHTAWLIGGGAAGLAAFAWMWRRIDVRALSGTLHEPPPELAWDEEVGREGDLRYARSHSFDAAFAEQDARARAGELGGGE